MFCATSLKKKMEALKNTSVNPSRWHLSSDVFLKLQEAGWIDVMSEDHDTVKTCMGLPISVRHDLTDYVSIE